MYVNTPHDDTSCVWWGQVGDLEQGRDSKIKVSSTWGSVRQTDVLRAYQNHLGTASLLSP